MYNRVISLDKNRSFFLFGQRGTGKSSLLLERFKDSSLYIDLLDSKTFLTLKTAPWKLKEFVLAKKPSQEIVIIDEIQKIPELLDEVHSLIEKNNINFALTGSSARKLKKAGVNMLAGRAYNYKLFPLTFQELGADFDLDSALQWGSLPRIFSEDTKTRKEEYLYSYITTYLKEEIIAEQLIRNIDPFNRFLESAAQTNSQAVVFDNIAKDTGTSGVTIKEYFQILEDTLIGFLLPAFHYSIRKRQKHSPKFYFYDLGLVRALQNQLSIKPNPQTFEYGQLFETFIINEIIRLSEYAKKRWRFSHLRINDNQEIDLIIETPNKLTLLIEIKSRDNVGENETNNLNLFAKDFKKPRCFCLSRDNSRKQIGQALCLHWREGIEEILELS